MDLGLGSTLLAGDPCLVDHIVGEVKSQGIFDQFRKECIADVDTKPAYQNLRTRVESSVNSFLNKQVWRPDLNKNQLRETLRKHIHDAPYLDAGVERIVDQVVNPKVYSVFMPQIEDVVYKFLGLERPKTSRERNGPCHLKDLLPKDLDPVSPESDKNSLKDVSLDSVDAEPEALVPRRAEDRTAAGEDETEDRVAKEREADEKEAAKEQEEKEEEAASTKVCLSVLDQQRFNCSVKSEDKIEEEEEEDSPTFEPIDIMNLNESNVSNDSHLSGISELTSHRSRSPDLSNETSHENMDLSNQDSQFSKVSSDSRLSIVTDFGSSNHASTPLSDVPKDERDRSEGKYSRDNFRAVREFETGRGKETGKASQESSRDETRASKKSGSSKETSSRELADTLAKDARDKSREGDSSTVSRSKNSREAKRDKETRGRRPEGNDEKTKRTKQRSESSRDSVDKPRDSVAKTREHRESERKENNGGKESKDLKDMYKEKIRELRERKELTEKEKFGKETKSSRDTREKGDSSREAKRDSKDSSKAVSSKPRSSRSDAKTPKSEGKTARSESRGKRDESKRGKDHGSRNSLGGSDSNDRIDSKKSTKTEKDEKSEKAEKFEARPDSDGKKRKSAGKCSRSDSSRNSDGNKRDSKSETEKKRREDKKSKVKDDHSSLRKNPDDRRSTDRDGSNGSNGRTSQKSNSGAATAGASKSVNSGLSKESITPSSNSSGETSDSVEEKQTEKSALPFDAKKPEASRIVEAAELSNEKETFAGGCDLERNEISLPIKKRPLSNENAEVFSKKPKFAKNFQEAKRLMKIRRRMERDESRRRAETERTEDIVDPKTTGTPTRPIVKDEPPSVPDEERVQIIEVRDEEYDEPYPEVRSDFTLEERSQIILGHDSIFASHFGAEGFGATSNLSEMEASIRQSLREMISDGRLEETKDRATKPRVSFEREDNLEGSLVPEFSRSNLPGAEESSETRDAATGVSVHPEAHPESCSELAETHRNEKEQIENDSVQSGTRESSAIDESAEPASSPKQIGCDVEGARSEDSHSLDTRVENVPPESSQIERVLEATSKIRSTIEDRPDVEGKIKESGEKMSESNNKMGEMVGEPKPKREMAEKKVETRKKFERKTEIEDCVTGKPGNDNVGELEFGISVDSKAETTMKLTEESKIRIETPEDKNIGESVETASISPEVVEPVKSTPPMEEEIASCLSEDEAPCLYFVRDNERLERFAKFMKSLESEDSSGEEHQPEVSSTEVAPALSKSMAPPKPKRKYSSSPLTDILLNNANNNNDAHKNIEPLSDHEDTGSGLKKRKIGRPKKRKNNASTECSQQQSLTNGENFVMPLSPESDVSATSEKAPTMPLKDEKIRPRGSNQRYTSDDLYKPRPLFSSSSRRSRRSNPA